jgi:iron complex transport system ATP-binding protein
MLTCDALQVQLGRFSLGPLSATAKQGEVTVVVGPNASGKTTLLRAAAGVQGVDVGEVRLDERALALWSRGPLACRLAFVEQRLAADVPLSVEQVLSLAQLRSTSLGKGGHLSQVIDDFDLGPLRNRPMPSLSVGQRQRVHVARAFAQVAKEGVLVLDEPTAPLDPDWSCRVWGLLRDFASQGGTVLVSVHDLAAASVVAQSAWLLQQGQLIAEGRAEAVLSPESLSSLFGLPFVPVGDARLPVPAWFANVRARSIDLANGQR